MPYTNRLPQFLAAGEALTDLIAGEAHQWLSKEGGAPWNVARALANWGCASAFAGAVSQDVFGDGLWQASAQAGLDLRFIQRYPQPPLLAIVPCSQRPEYFFIGNDSADLYFDAEKLPHGWQNELQWAHFGGISLAREPLATKLLQMARDLKQRGVKISYDPNYRNLMDSRYDTMLAHMCGLANLIKVSDDDLTCLFRTEDQATALAQLRALNPNAVVLQTLGAAGAKILYGAQIEFAQPPAISVVDTIGAGDASAAGMLCSLMHAPLENWDTHLQFAVAAGAAACLHAGAAAPSMASIKQVLHQMQIEQRADI